MNLIASTDTQQSWPINKVRIFVFYVILISASVLLIRTFLLAPQPPVRPYLLAETSNESILRSLEWYAKNSIGSLRTNENRCLVESKDYSISCSGLNLGNTNATSINNILNKEALIPYSWKTKTYDKNITLEFALFNIQPLRIISTKERSTIFGEELIVNAEFEKTSISKVSEELISTTQLNELKNQIGKKLVLEITYQPNPYGYYLPIYPKPSLH